MAQHSSRIDPSRVATWPGSAQAPLASKNMKASGILVAAVAVVLGALLDLSADTPIAGDLSAAADGGPAGVVYEIAPVKAPRAAGFALQALDFLATRSLLGPPLRRALLRDSNVHLVRELAAAIELPPLHHPMHRRSAAAAEPAAALLGRGGVGAAAPTSSVSAEELLAEALASVDAAPASSGASSSLSSVEDYARAYRRGGGATPRAVARSVLSGAAALEARRLKIFSWLEVCAVFPRAFFKSGEQQVQNCARSAGQRGARCGRRGE